MTQTVTCGFSWVWVCLVGFCLGYFGCFGLVLSFGLFGFVEIVLLVVVVILFFVWLFGFGFKLSL